MLVFCGCNVKAVAVLSGVNVINRSATADVMVDLELFIVVVGVFHNYLLFIVLYEYVLCCWAL